MDKIQAKNETANRGPKIIVQTLLKHPDEKVKIAPQKKRYKHLIYNDLFILIFRWKNLPGKQPRNTRRNFAQKVPSISKKIYFHVTQGALFPINAGLSVSCSIVTVWLTYVLWKSIWITRLGRASLPTSGGTQTKENT